MLDKLYWLYMASLAVALVALFLDNQVAGDLWLDCIFFVAAFFTYGLAGVLLVRDLRRAWRGRYAR